MRTGLVVLGVLLVASDTALLVMIAIVGHLVSRVESLEKIAARIPPKFTPGIGLAGLPQEGK